MAIRNDGSHSFKEAGAAAAQLHCVDWTEAEKGLRVWLLSPYHTGSHRAWAEGYQRHSKHIVRLLTLAGRFWKWRMQGGAIELAAQVQSELAAGPPDLVLATDMTHLPAWLALSRRTLPAKVPLVLYMHENQLTYPWQEGQKPDLTYAMINWLGQLCSDRILFNSEFHRRSWFGALPNLLKHFPDYNHLELIEEVKARAGVLPVGVEPLPGPGRLRQAGAPLIVWNQRWEYDKRPRAFFELLYRLEQDAHDFSLAVAGENFRNTPDEFEEARGRLAHRIEHWGYLRSRQAYLDLLRRADLVISTAGHEFFGISILEAVQAGAFPLLPNRLSYPELIPASLHPACLYDDEEELFLMAAARLRMPRAAPPSLQRSVRERYSWPVVAAAYDSFFESLVDAVG